MIRTGKTGSSFAAPRPDREKEFAIEVYALLASCDEDASRRLLLKRMRKCDVFGMGGTESAVVGRFILTTLAVAEK